MCFGHKELDGIPLEGIFHTHQVPITDVCTNPDHLYLLETWIQSYRPAELSDAQGHLIYELAELTSKGRRRMGAQPHSNGGRLLIDLDLPDFTVYAVDIPAPGTCGPRQPASWDRTYGMYSRKTSWIGTSTSSVPMKQRRTACFVGKTILIDDHVSLKGRVMEVVNMIVAGK